MKKCSQRGCGQLLRSSFCVEQCMALPSKQRGAEECDLGALLNRLTDLVGLLGHPHHPHHRRPQIAGGFDGDFF